MTGDLYSPHDCTQEDLERFVSEIDRLVPVDLGITVAVKVPKDAAFIIRGDDRWFANRTKMSC